MMFRVWVGLFLALSVGLWVQEAHAVGIGKTCSRNSSCDAGLHCYATPDGNFCSHICDPAGGYPPGAVGSISPPDRRCETGASHSTVYQGSSVKARICTSRCTTAPTQCAASFGGTCGGVSGWPFSKVCGCTSDSQCKSGRTCNKQVFGNSGFCATRVTGKSCPTGFVCKVFTYGPKICQPLASCGNGSCEASKSENCGTCPQDCKCTNGQTCQNNACKVPPNCGNGTCEPTKNENCGTCAADCKCASDKTCQSNACKDACGDGTCDTTRNENCTSCAKDCPCPTKQFCQSNACEDLCGDGKCEAAKGEHCGTCAKDCACPTGQICKTNACAISFPCGNGMCEADKQENCTSCPQDCGCKANEVCNQQKCEAASKCGNGNCESQFGENCSACAKDCACPTGQSCLGGICNPDAGCGDSTCDDKAGENCDSCPQDCKCNAPQVCQQKLCVEPKSCTTQADCPAATICESGTCKALPSCQDKTCDTGKGENCQNCPSDCPCGSGNTCQDGGCQPNQGCGNGSCETAKGENCLNCPKDCPCPPGQSCNRGACGAPQPETQPEPTPLPEIPLTTEPPSTDAATPDTPALPAAQGSLRQPCINGVFCNVGLECLPTQGGTKTVCLPKQEGCGCSTSPQAPLVPLLFLLLFARLLRRRQRSLH